jgi:hypothetical protein
MDQNHPCPSCELLVVESSDGIDEPPTLITMNQLVPLLEREITDHGGRLSLSPYPTSTINVKYQTTNKLLDSLISNSTYHPFLYRAVERLSQRSQVEHTDTDIISPRIQLLQESQTLVSSEYLENVIHHIFNRFEQDETVERIMIQDMAKSTFHLPTDLLYTSIQKFLKVSPKRGFVLNHGGKDGTKQLISPRYIQRKKMEICQTLSAFQEPAILELKWFHNLEWDVGAIVEFIQSSCSDGNSHDNFVNASLDADFHTMFDSNYTMGQAVYIPHSYVKMQQEKIMEFYTRNGYVSVHQCVAWGISKSRIKDVIMELLVSLTCGCFFFEASS